VVLDDLVWQNKTGLCFSLLCWDFNKIFCCLFNLFYHGESYFENCYSLLSQQTYCFIRNRCKHVLPWPFILKDSTLMFNFTCLALFLFRRSFSCNKWKCKNREYSMPELLDLTVTAIRHTTVNDVSPRFQNVRAEITMHCFFFKLKWLVMSQWYLVSTKKIKVYTVYTRTGKNIQQTIYGIRATVCLTWLWHWFVQPCCLLCIYYIHMFLCSALYILQMMCFRYCICWSCAHVPLRSGKNDVGKW